MGACLQPGELIVLNVASQLWTRHLIPALGCQRQMDLCESEASLVYREFSDMLKRYAEKSYLKKKFLNIQQKWSVEFLGISSLLRTKVPGRTTAYSEPSASLPTD